MRSLDGPEEGAGPSGVTTSSPDIGAIAVASLTRLKVGDKLHVTLVRGPIVSTTKAFNNEATPCIALAYLSAYIADHGDTYAVVDMQRLMAIWPTTRSGRFWCK